MSSATRFSVIICGELVTCARTLDAQTAHFVKELRLVVLVHRVIVGVVGEDVDVLEMVTKSCASSSACGCDCMMRVMESLCGKD